MYTFKKILYFLKRSYALDKRALAAMRIGIALLILIDLIIRASDLVAHYTEEGVWPGHLVYNFGWKAGYWSIHLLFDSANWQTFLFALHMLLSLFLLLGYKTRMITISLFLMSISLHNRNLFVLQAGDDLLRLVLLWGVFLPWGRHYSFDAKNTKKENKGPALAEAGYLLLIASVYLFAVALRDIHEWGSEASAGYYALSLEQLRLPFGDLIYYHPSLLQILTRLVFFSEFLIPILVLWPSSKPNLRSIAFVLILFLQIGFGLTLFVGLFYLICIVSAIGLLPPRLFDKVDQFVKPRKIRINVMNKVRFQTVLLNCLCAVLLSLCLLINLGHLSWFEYRLKDEVSSITNCIRLDQYWGMFSPGVLRKDGWYVYHGMDSLGRQWDLRLNRNFVDYEKPASIVSMYKNDRWRKLAENIQNDRFTFLRPLYCNYVLREWNKKYNNKPMLSLQLYFMEKINLPDYKTKKPLRQLFCVCSER